MFRLHELCFFLVQDLPPSPPQTKFLFTPLSMTDNREIYAELHFKNENDSAWIFLILYHHREAPADTLVHTLVIRTPVNRQNHA